MKTRIWSRLLFLMFVLLSSGVNAQLIVSDTLNPAQLAQRLAGPGVTLSNIQLNCPAGASGAFRSIGTNLGLSSGILLTTGSIHTIADINLTGDMTTNNQAGGDPQLNALIPNFQLFDACVLSFDFVPSSDTLEITYIFASEEYNEWVGSPYNDVFGFLVSGPGISGWQNIALIPGTNLPVAINNVNNNSFNQYYIDNENPIGMFIEYDGFTTPLIAKLPVTPGQTYSIKIGVADAEDHTYDSGVFLKENSFSSPVQVPPLVWQNQQITGESCPGAGNGTISISVSGGLAPYSYSWSAGLQAQPIQTGLIPGVYSVTVQDAAGQNLTASFNVAASSNPVAGFAGKRDVSCHNGNNGMAWINLTGGTPPFSYSWNTGATTDSLFSLSPGVYSCTITDGYGCTTTVTATVGQAAALVISGQVTDAGCFGQYNGAIAVQVSGGTSPYSYNWNNNSQSNLLQQLGAGSYAITVSDASGCSATQSFTVSEFDALQFNFQIIEPVSCKGMSDAVVLVTSPLNNHGYQFSLNGSPLQSNPQFSNLSAGGYWLRAQSPIGCMDSLQFQISEPDLLSIQFVQVQQPGCNAQASGFVDVFATGGTPPYLFSGNGVSGQANGMFSGLQSGLYTFTVTDSRQCANGDTVRLHAAGTLQLSVEVPPLAQCSESPVAFVHVQNAAMPYTLIIDGSVWTHGDTITNLSSGMHQAAVTDAAGCNSALQFYLPQSNGIQLSLEYIEHPACFGETGNAIFTVVSQGSWSLEVNGQNIGQQTQISGLAPGWHQVVATNASHCSAAINFRIENPELLEVQIMESVPPSCPGQADGKIKFEVTGGAPPYTVWFNDSLISAGNLLAGLGAGGFTIKAQDANQCQVVRTVTLLEPNSGSFDVSPAVSICRGDSVKLYANGGIEYHWFPEENITNPGISDPVAFPENSTVYTVLINGGNCGFHTAEVPVTVVDRPMVSLKTDSLTLASGIILTIEGDGEVLWTPADGLDCPTCKEVIAKPKETTTYTATLTDGTGCKTTVSVTVHPKEIQEMATEVFLPNTFTPNGDGLNDLFFVRGAEEYRILLQIFDRSGTKVFETRDHQYGWDGTYQNKRLSSGVYTWILHLDAPGGEKILKKGNLTLLR